MTIEVLDGELAASRWKAAYGDVLTESAVTNGALFWDWSDHPWGVVLELCFPDEQHWGVWLALPAVSAALDSVPDRVSGLLIYRGRGGSSGRPVPRKPHPLVGAGAMALPEPDEDVELADPGGTPKLLTREVRQPAGDPHAA